MKRYLEYTSRWLLMATWGILELYLLAFSPAYSKARREHRVMNSNTEFVYSNRKLMCEYIVLMSKTGNYGYECFNWFLNERIWVEWRPFKGSSSTSNIKSAHFRNEEYIQRLFERFEHNAPYEIAEHPLIRNHGNWGSST